MIILINKLKDLINDSEAIVIGAGAGLSTSAGFTYDGERFEKYFEDFEMKYKFRDMYSGGFYPYETLEEKWAFWSRNIFINRYLEPPKPVYKNLFEVVKDKNYFVITTNVDHCFQKAGFDKKRLFYTQGDYGLFQCSVPCHKKTYDNEKIILEMLEKQKNMKVPSNLVPYCPKCGSPMEMNLRSDDSFVEDEGWNKACENYYDFLEKNLNKRVLFFEIGGGMNTPVIIKFPFQRMTLENKNAFYVCVNTDVSYIPNEIRERSLLIQKDISEVINELS